MEQNDQNTILRSLVDLTKLLDLNDTFLSLLQQKFRVFSSEMVEDILVISGECVLLSSVLTILLFVEKW